MEQQDKIVEEATKRTLEPMRFSLFSLYCNSRLQECGADALVNRWQRVDELTKVLVALTATGSAVSGWALWQQGSFRAAWAVLAGLTAALAIVHTALGVAARVADWGRLKQYFVNLRLDLESFATRTAIGEGLSSDEWRRQLMVYRERYKQGLELVRNDFLYTSRLGKKITRRLASQLRKERDGASPHPSARDLLHLFLRHPAARRRWAKQPATRGPRRTTGPVPSAFSSKRV